MSDHDPFEPWELSSPRDRERSESHRGIAAGSATGFRSVPQPTSRAEQRGSEAERWARNTRMRLIQARSVPELLWATTTLAEERSFAAGAAYGLASTAASLVIGPLELVRMFALAELYEAVDGSWRRVINAARSLPGPLGMVAYKTVFGDEFGPMRSLLREYYEERERFVEQIEKITEHPQRFVPRPQNRLISLISSVSAALSRSICTNGVVCHRWIALKGPTWLLASR